MNKDDAISESECPSRLETMYKEHWEHSRHCEKEMFWFTNLYVAVVTAIFYIMRDIGGDQQTNLGLTLVLVFFGLILSVFGFMVMFALSLGHHNYIMNIVTICYRWDVMEFYANPKKPVFLKRVFRYLYEITIALFVALSLYYGYKVWGPLKLFHDHPLWLVLISAIIFIHIEGFYQWKWRKYVTERKDFVKTLRNDIEGYYRRDWNKWFKSPEFWIKIARDAEIRKKKAE